MNVQHVFQKVCNKSLIFVKRNSSTILTCAGALGVVGTAVASGQASTKASRLLEEAKQEKGSDLTKLEAVCIACPIYIPTVLLGASTIACIFGANALNKRQQSAMMSAYALLDASFKEYKLKVQELYGDDADINIRTEIAKDKYDICDIKLEGEELLFYDEYSQRYFNATMEDILRAEMLLNKDLQCHGYTCINELYSLLNIPETDFGDFLIWSTSRLTESKSYAWIEFNHMKVEMEDGMECYILEILTEPIPESQYGYY